MNLKNLMSLVLLVLLVAGIVLTSERVEARIMENITPQEAFTLIEENRDNPDFVIIDVRTRQEFAEGHIENAVNIDFYSDTFRDDLENLDKNKTYLIYCRSGGRSGSALNIMAELNFSEVYNIPGGITRWKAEGLPVIE